MNNDNVNILMYRNSFLKYGSISTNIIFEYIGCSRSPLVSIVIPTYQRTKELKDAINSAINQQKYEGCYEVIIVDNNSSITCINEMTQFLSKIAYKNINIKYYQNSENIGMFGNWNRCVELSEGEWISFLHDDDVLHPNYLLSVTEMITKNSRIEAICSNVQYFGNKSSWKNSNSSSKQNLKKIAKRYLFDEMAEIKIFDSIILNSNPYGEPSCGLILKKRNIINLGGFDESYGAVADWFFLFRYNSNHRIYKPFFVTGFYRWEVNESMNPKTIHEFFKGFELMRKYGSEHSKTGYYLYKFFRAEQHMLKVIELRSIIENAGLNKNSFDYICPNKIRFFRLLILRFVNNIYKKIKRISIMINKMMEV
ncbi:MAG: glycosyltransferase family 2 protein [Eubacteriales bacterium]